MTWVKLSDTALDEPFLLNLDRGAVLLHVEALAYSNRYATDGRIHRAALRKMTTEPDPDAAAASLVKAGLWEAAEDGWQLVWLLDDQPSSLEINQAREQARTRQERKRLHNKGQHQKCDPERCKVLVSRRDNPRDAMRDNPREIQPPPTRPSPTLPDRGEGEGSSRQDDIGPEGPVVLLPKRSAIERRRELARAIREAQVDPLKKRYLRTFDREFGHLYPQGRVA